MINKSIVSDYLRNPFFWWGLITLLFLTKFDTYFIINKINQAIWIKQFYILIILPALVIAFVLLIYPIRRGLTEFVKKKENKKAGIIFILTVVMIFMLEVTIFFIDVIQIMLVQIPQAITDKAKLEYNLNVKDVLGFLALPIVSFVAFHNMKSQLEKNGLEYDDKLRNNLKFVLWCIGCCVVVTIIAGLILWK